MFTYRQNGKINTFGFPMKLGKLRLLNLSKICETFKRLLSENCINVLSTISAPCVIMQNTNESAG